jgi:hypothetical protein
MKKLVILPAVILFAGIVAKAQDNAMPEAKAVMEIKDAKAEKKEAKKELKRLESNEPGVLVKDHFYEDFGDLSATWRRTANFQEASFILDGKKTTAYYDIDAELVGTTSVAKFSEIPESAQHEILKHYKDYSIDRTILFDDNEDNTSDMVMYGSTIGSDQDHYYVELSKANKMLVLQVNMDGGVSFFTEKNKMINRQ